MTRTNQQQQISTIAIVGLVILVVVISSQIPATTGQITFSKDWRAGGKRSSSPLMSMSPSSTTFKLSSGLRSNNVPCDKMEEYSTSMIRDLVRKEAVALLQCEFIVNKSKTTGPGPAPNNNSEEKKKK